jgi:dipeptidyl aminopeptidase/acylaminoacyl peptidase
MSYFLLLFSCSLWGQVEQKKALSVTDYATWGHLDFDKIAPSTAYFSYSMRYDNGQDTLFVQNTKTPTHYAFPKGENSLFTKHHGFLCQSGDSLLLLDMKKNTIDTITTIKDYSYSEHQDKIAVLLQNESLIIRSPFEKTAKIVIADVSHFSLSPDGKFLAYTTFANQRNSFILLELSNLNAPTTLVSDSLTTYQGSTWQKEGKSIAFYEYSHNNTIFSLYWYSIEQKRLYQLNPKSSVFPIAHSIVAHPFYKLLISDDSKKVFFSIQNDSEQQMEKATSSVEIWHTQDRWIYPEEQQNGRIAQSPKIALWYPETQQVHPITSNALPKIMLSGDQEHAILSNPKAYEPQFEFEGPRDFYILNCATQEKKKFLTQHSSFYLDIIPSPSGRYIAYFKENHWWIYNIKQDTHTNITKHIPSTWLGKVHTLKPQSAYGTPGWCLNDTAILLYDAYDLWAVSPDGSSFKRLTYGKASKIRFRIADIPNQRKLNFVYDGLVSHTYDLNQNIVLKAESEDGKTGFYRWQKDRKVIQIVFENSSNDPIHYDSNQQLFFYIEQRFDVPPRIIKTNISTKQIVFESNLQHRQFHWGKSELIHFQNSKKQLLKGVLYYPANYNPSKQYPMIVNIYEKQSGELHWYHRPTLYNESGFNPTIFTTNGYFCFLPDILLEEENVGPSALDCVVAGTQKIIAMGIIAPDKIGLMGHSFGGYETAFISNHCSLFATAIASGAVTDLNSFFLTVGWNSKKPDMWRFKSEQWLMNDKTPFANAVDFSRNSPLSTVQQLKIPLLLWSGKEDTQVDWHQSVSYYLALRRLKKKATLLLYPKEGHTLLNPTHQKDLTERVLQWFGYHLKGEPPASWILNNQE